jgi:osmotically inducible protein OsmC
VNAATVIKEAPVANAERTAEVVWKGTLAKGEGSLTLTSGAAADLPVTWASRTERSNGMTSPEELIAAAHASCFSMALSGGLTEAGTPPQRLDVRATCTFAQTEGGWAVAGVALNVRGEVPGIDGAAFAAAAAAAKDGCPVSRALGDSVKITVTATLA